MEPQQLQHLVVAQLQEVLQAQDQEVAQLLVELQKVEDKWD